MTVQAESIESLRTAVRGNVITPADAGYEDARRVWNAIIDRHPAAIVRCRAAADVIATVNFARDNHLPLAIRGGAHNVAGRCTCDDGIVIDFSEMKSIRVDPAARDRSCRAGTALGGVRSRNPGVRPGDDRRYGRRHRHRRPDARRRIRLARRPPRHDRRQPDQRRRRPGEWHARSRVRSRESGSDLGAARRRRQLRRRHFVRVQGPSDRADDRRRHHHPSVPAGCGGAALLRRVHPPGARRSDRCRGDDDHARRSEGVRLRRRVRRASRRRPEGGAAAQGVRNAGHRHDWRHPVRCAAVAARGRDAAEPSQLLEGGFRVAR